MMLAARQGGKELDRDRLLSTARHERDALGRTIQYTPPDRWETDSSYEGWQLRDIVAHLAGSEVAAASMVAGEEASEVEEYRKALGDDPLTAEIWNAWTVERRREDGVVGLGLEWGRAASRLLALAADASEEDWAGRQIPWIAGDLRLRYLVQARVAEWWTHGEDIREGGSLPPRREHWPAFAVNDLAIRLTPRSLARAGTEAEAGTVQFDLTGVGGGSWRQSVIRGAASEDRKPDAFVSGDGYSFASVAVGRADLEFCLYEGLINTGGDAQLAEAVLRSLRAFP